ncbi:oxidoreductase [Mucilaginibacter conchicola]|uniref:Oxidoreductase n=1 Tax=Mucilaginibacter conchicola TaxID=2303333 RepID=A0A372NNL8_9SPHI|nr:YCF48-related protein [Mucilaginibacter conchicola]RFZ90468.1 oxidoreductase [Mucilaginibacter conchicola]
MLRIYIAFLFLFTVSVTIVSAQTVVNLSQGRKTSIRGLSVINDNTAWLSGSGGTVAITHDGGKTWDWQQVKGFEKSDFRDIEAFSDKEAVIISSGSPAYILKTTDGGQSWEKKFEQADTTYFLDAMDFENPKHGFVLGDPINGKFLLLETKDGGNTWAQVKDAPNAVKNEGAFAASGTCLRVTNKYVAIVTGGSESRLISSPLNRIAWAYESLPLTNGAASMGAFSIAFGKNEKVIVGGNYAKDRLKDSVAFVIQFGKTQVKPFSPAEGPAGYQSGVEHLREGIYLSTGTSGTNITTDGGKTWKKIDAASYNVCRKAKNGSVVLLAGDRGNISLLKF